MDPNTPTANKFSVISPAPKDVGPLKIFLEDQLEDLRTCPICLDTFKDPRALPCCHTFCCQCIEKIVENERRISCPCCRRVFNLNGKPSDVLYRNHRAATLIELKPIEIQSPKKCDSCENAALDLCFHYNRSACQNCVVSHHKDQLESNRKLVREIEQLTAKTIEFLAQTRSRFEQLMNDHKSSPTVERNEALEDLKESSQKCRKTLMELKICALATIRDLSQSQESDVERATRCLEAINKIKNEMCDLK
ncbi:hypothetical protein ACOME3_010504 [Neoechinorhynchus agilis]